MKRSLEDRAREFATAAHEGQVRKFTNEPYIVHPTRVVEMVKALPSVTLGPCPDEALATAYLHDVVEDCGISLSLIDDLFGATVSAGVDWLTEDPELKAKKIKRAIRKWMYADRIRLAPPWVKTIKLADLLDNTPSIIKNEPKFAPVYLKEKRHLLDTALLHGDPSLWQKADEILKQNGY